MAKEDCKQCEMLLSTELQEIKSMILRLDNAIRGNGKEGLVTRLAKTETIQKVLLWVVAIQATAVVGLVARILSGIVASN